MTKKHLKKTNSNFILDELDFDYDISKLNFDYDFTKLNVDYEIDLEKSVKEIDLDTKRIMQQLLKDTTPKNKGTQ